MATPEPYLCEVCQGHIDPAADVVSAIEQVSLASRNAKVEIFVIGRTALFHARHWDERSGKWREVGRGMLCTLRPSAT